MFGLNSLRSTFSSNGATGNRNESASTLETNGRLSDSGLEILDPLLLRLNHQRQLQQEKVSRKESGEVDSELYIGWGHEKDPFDLESTSSEDDEEIHSYDLNIKTEQHEDDGIKINTKSSQDQDSEPNLNFLGWGASSGSSVDETKSEELLVTELSIRGGLSDSSLLKKTDLCTADADLSSLECGNSIRRMSPESINEDCSIVFGDQSTDTGKTSTNASSHDNSGRLQRSRSQVFQFSTKDGDNTSKSPIRRDNMFRRSTTTSVFNAQPLFGRRPSMMSESGGDSECDSKSTGRMRRRQSFSNILSASLRNIGADNLAASFRPLIPNAAQSQLSANRPIRRKTEDEDEECPRLQQLKEQSTDELHNELVRIQVQSKSNLEKSWTEAERIRQNNDDLDKKIALLKAKLEKAKAAVAASSAEKLSSSHDSCAASAVSESVQPPDKPNTRNFSSAALNALLGNNYNGENTPNSNILPRSESDSRAETTKKLKGRRKSFIAEIGTMSRNYISDHMSCASSGSTLGMAIDDSSVRDNSVISGLYRQCFEENKSEAVSIISRTLSRDEWEHKSHAGSNIATDADSVSDIRSAFHSPRSSVNSPTLNDHTIFEMEAMKLKMNQLDEQLSANADEIAKIKTVLEKQNGEFKTHFYELQRANAGGPVKKLQELESSSLVELADFNHCFRAVNAKLETIEAIAFEIKHSLDHNTCTISFENIQLDNTQLIQAKEHINIGDESDTLHSLDMLNNGTGFHHYKNCRERIIGNMYRIAFLEADVWNHLVKIRLLIESVDNDEGTQTTESSMASERRALERVFIDAMLPHIQFAHLAMKNVLAAFRENLKSIKWWNHVIDCMDSFREYEDMTSCIDFITNYPPRPLKKDIAVLRRILELTSEQLAETEASMKQECTTFRSKVKRAGLAFNISSDNDMSLENIKLSAKDKSLCHTNAQNSNLRSKILEKRRVMAEKEKLLKNHVAQLQLLHARADQELFNSQIQLLDEMKNQVQILSSKMVEHDSLVSSLTDTREKKAKRVNRFQKAVGDQMRGGL